jgi:hypothetical protein
MELTTFEIEYIKSNKFGSMLRVYSYMVDGGVMWTEVLAGMGYTGPSILDLMRAVPIKSLVRYMLPDLPNYGIYMTEDELLAKIRPEFREDAEVFILEWKMMGV